MPEVMKGRPLREGGNRTRLVPHGAERVAAEGVAGAAGEYQAV